MNNQQTPMLFPVPFQEVLDKIRELVRAELQHAKPAKEKPVSYEVSGMTQKPLYKAAEVCAMFQISRQTLHSWVVQGLLKQYKIKSRTFYLWADLEKLISSQEKK